MMQLEQQVGIPELACDARQLAEKLPGDVGLAARVGDQPPPPERRKDLGRAARVVRKAQRRVVDFPDLDRVPATGRLQGRAEGDQQRQLLVCARGVRRLLPQEFERLAQLPDGFDVGGSLRGPDAGLVPAVARSAMPASA